jgi:hypothetical protein
MLCDMDNFVKCFIVLNIHERLVSRGLLRGVVFGVRFVTHKHNVMGCGMWLYFLFHCHYTDRLPHLLYFLFYY